MALSELHLALIGAGVVGVLLVWAYNLWQDRQHRKTAERIFNGDGAPVGDPVAAVADPCAKRVEPSLEAGPGPDAAESAAPAASVPAPTDAVVECVLRLGADQPIAAPVVLGMQGEWSGKLTKPLSWLVQTEDGEWRAVGSDDTVSYREWVSTLQLVDRRGPATEAEIAAFQAGVAAIAREVAAVFEPGPAASDLAAHAGALDSFCAGVDIQFQLNVVEAAGGSFPGTKLRGLAEAAGMALEDDGEFHLRDEAGGELFSLGNLGPEPFDAEGLRSLATHGVSFSLDVPRAADGTAAFERMLAAAQQLAAAIGGVLVDAQRAPLSEAMIAAIRAKIGELQARMREGGIDPGSPRALRLFS